MIDYRELGYVNGEAWVRRAGEEGFHRLEPCEVSSEEVAPVESREYEVELEVTDERVRAVLKEELGVEVEGSLPQQIRLRLKRHEVEVLKKHSIELRLQGEHGRGETPEPSGKKDDGQSSSVAGKSQTIIFREDFEVNTVPGSVWAAGDLNPSYGEDYWGDQSVGEGARVRTGNWSCYCAAHSDIIGQQYDDNMDAYFSNISPIDLAPYETAYLCFSFWYETEPGYDSLLWYWSPDGSTWYLGDGWTGSSGGWQTIEYSLTGFNDFYLKFVFRSDGVVHSYEGAYIDDIVISSSRLPNLVPYQPTGWDYPVVPSSVPGTHTVNDLYEDIQTYIDWAVANNWAGDVEDTFYVYLYLDEDLIGGWYATALPSGYYAPLEDWAYTVTDSGLHTLRLVVDATDRIAELYELDNVYEHEFHWQPAWVTVRGYLQYHDHNTGLDRAIPFARVSLYDEDAGEDELLGGGSTDGYGYYSIGPVWNIDDEGGTQDVYVRLYAEASTEYLPSSAVRVIDSTGALWSFETPVVQDVYGGDYDMEPWRCPPEDDGAYHIYEVILGGYDWVRALPGSPEPSQVTVRWFPGQKVGTSYDPSEHWIYVRGDSSVPEYAPDEWDDGIILHEYGHFIADIFDFLSPVGGQHWWDEKYDPRLSWNEGWAHYFACAVMNTESYLDTRFDGEAIEFDLETGIASFTDGTPPCFANALGESCEASVGGALWDVFDAIDDDQEGDGIGDNLSDGPDNIWDVVYYYETAGHGPHTINEYWDGWFARGHDYYTEMHHIWCEHGMESQAGIDESLAHGAYTLGFWGACPNPFGWTAAIRFSLGSKQRVCVRIYDASGRLVRSLIDGALPPGWHEVRWDGKDDMGRSVSSGVYLVEFETCGFKDVRKIVCLR